MSESEVYIYIYIYNLTSKVLPIPNIHTVNVIIIPILVKTVIIILM